MSTIFFHISAEIRKIFTFLYMNPEKLKYFLYNKIDMNCFFNNVKESLRELNHKIKF